MRGTDRERSGLPPRMETSICFVASRLIWTPPPPLPNSSPGSCPASPFEKNKMKVGRRSLIVPPSNRTCTCLCRLCLLVAVNVRNVKSPVRPRLCGPHHQAPGDVVSPSGTRPGRHLPRPHSALCLPEFDSSGDLVEVEFRDTRPFGLLGSADFARHPVLGSIACDTVSSSHRTRTDPRRAAVRAAAPGRAVPPVPSAARGVLQRRGHSVARGAAFLPRYERPSWAGRHFSNFF